ncbi:MarR family transcriptional regulator [Micromonospora aurantiaca (nom. illeg.)]|uniref:MarR family transcriptional regulator n=1 Tax=Micromonospora aurantiaca (nom. illeg.) TaxID=47850 RepID=UPI0033DE13C6
MTGRSARPGALAAATSRLCTYTAYGWWLLSGGRVGRGLHPDDLTPAQRLVCAAVHHHDCVTATGGVYSGCQPDDLVDLTSMSTGSVKSALHRLVRLRWLDRDTSSGTFQVSTRAYAFTRSGWLDDPALAGEPLIDVLTDPSD